MQPLGFPEIGWEEAPMLFAAKAFPSRNKVTSYPPRRRS